MRAMFVAIVVVGLATLVYLLVSAKNRNRRI